MHAGALRTTPAALARQVPFDIHSIGEADSQEDEGSDEDAVAGEDGKVRPAFAWVLVLVGESAVHAHTGTHGRHHAIPSLHPDLVMTCSVQPVA